MTETKEVYVYDIEVHSSIRRLSHTFPIKEMYLVDDDIYFNLSSFDTHCNIMKVPPQMVYKTEEMMEEAVKELSTSPNFTKEGDDKYKVKQCRYEKGNNLIKTVISKELYDNIVAIYQKQIQLNEKKLNIVKASEITNIFTSQNPLKTKN